MQITPFLLGNGRAGNAIQKSLAIVGLQYPEFKIAPCKILERGASLEGVAKKFENPILIIANPSGCHAETIQQAERAGFKAIIAEKPACVSLDEINALEKIKTPVAICHVYRQMWGIQTLKSMIKAGDFGEIISIEGRYWQSSTAQRILSKDKTPTWKNDPTLSGPYDVLLDIGTHWADAAIFLMGEVAKSGSLWLSYANAESSHRDSHVHLNLEFSKNRRAMASISKTVHGATNHFEINVIGALKSATWNFLNPDEISLGHGNQKNILTRKSTDLGSQQPPFHATGWLEGYVEIITQLLRDISGQPDAKYPSLSENLAMLKMLFTLKK